MNEFYNLKVIDKQKLTPESVSITLKIPEELKDIFKFKPGQFVMVEKEINGQNLRRYYSIYNSPDESNNLKLGIKFKGQDGFANYVMHKLQPGELLQVSAPMNDVPFDLDAGQKKNFLGITIGSGITPFYSYLQYLTKHMPHTKMVLIYGNDSPEKTMFYNELKSLAQQYPDQVKVYFVYSKSDQGDYKGRINKDIIQSVLEQENAGFDGVYMIGPDDLKKTAAQTLVESGIPTEHLHYRVYS